MILKDGQTVTHDPRLDRVPFFDPRSRDFPIAAVVPEELETKRWALPRARFLDQGQEGACVGFGFTHELAAAPVSTSKLDAAFARDVYHEAQRIDPWPGGAYEGASPFYEGTAVLAGAKVLTARGFYTGYRWGFSIDDVLRALSHEGPVVFGVAVLDSMFDPRPSGLLEVSGPLAGGHCMAGVAVTLHPRLRGEKLTEPVVALAQSWGLGFGNRGEVYLRASDLETLLKYPQHRGESCVPIGRQRPRRP